jgi:tRNA (uracil-5-)-methyltransferase TRM9
MDPKTRSALAELNRAFYARFAGDFARTRQSWPPGFERILPYLGPVFNVLDLGCGNARLFQFLLARGWAGDYVGLDGNRELLAIAAAAQNAGSVHAASARFVMADLLAPEWQSGLPGARYGAVASLAVLHHIPGARERAAFVSAAAHLLEPDGVLVLSTWQFLSSARLSRHILPWSAAGLSDQVVEPDDYLLSWGQQAAGQRYCAFIDEKELLRLAGTAALAPVDVFYADGLEGNLNLYGVFRATR